MWEFWLKIQKPKIDLRNYPLEFQKIINLYREAYLKEWEGAKGSLGRASRALGAWRAPKPFAGARSVAIGHPNLLVYINSLWNEDDGTKK